MSNLNPAESTCLRLRHRASGQPDHSSSGKVCLQSITFRESSTHFRGPETRIAVPNDCSLTVYTSHGEKRCVWPAAEGAGVCPDGVQSANACAFALRVKRDLTSARATYNPGTERPWFFRGRVTPDSTNADSTNADDQTKTPTSSATRPHLWPCWTSTRPPLRSKERSVERNPKRRNSTFWVKIRAVLRP